MNREELAWAAGFVDGEGCFTAHRDLRNGRKYVDPRFILAQSSNEGTPIELLRFQNLFPFGRIYGPYKSTNGKKKAWHLMAQNFEHVQAIYAALFAFMCPVKRSQGKAILAEVRELKPRGRNRRAHRLF